MKLAPRSVLSLLFFVCLVSGASTAFAGDEWRPVDPADLAAKVPTVDKDADAEAIFWEVRIDDSSEENLSMQHYVRVKVFTERGREKYGKFDIPFTKGIKIKDIAARVIKADGSIVEILKDDVFEREIIKTNGLKVRAKSFAVPSLEPGVIVEYRYKEVISDAGASGMRLRFQRDIPVQSLSYYYKPYNKKTPNYQSFNFQDTKFTESDKGFWVASRKNVPALKEEPQMPPENSVIPWMLLQSVRVNISEAAFGYTISIKDPRNPASYWGSVGHDKAFLVKFMNKSDKEIKRVAEEVSASAETPDEKLHKLYDYCQTQINNTSFDPNLTDEQKKKLPKIESIGDVLKRKTASAGYIDMLFGAMANSLGYETRIALSGDRSEMFFKPDMTNESFVHLAAVAVKVGDGWRLFNPGTKFLPYGMLLWYEEDVWSLLVGDTKSSWEQIPPSDPARTISRRNGKFKLLEDGTLEGAVAIELNGQEALTYRMENYDKSDSKREEDFKADIKRRMSTAEVSEVTIENLTDANKPLITKFKIRVPQYAQKTGKRLFLQPSFFEYGKPSMFSSAERKYDVYFHYGWSQDDQMEFELPAGYSLDNAEKPMPFNAGDVSQYKISIGVTADSRRLVVHREFIFGGGGNLVFPQNSYPQVRRLFDELHHSDEHTITLKQSAAAN